MDEREKQGIERPGHSGFAQRRLIELYLTYGSIDRVMDAYPDFDYAVNSYESVLRKWGVVLFSKKPLSISQSEEAFRAVIDTGNALKFILRRPRWEIEGTLQVFMKRLSETVSGKTSHSATAVFFYDSENPDMILIGQDQSAKRISSTSGPSSPPMSFTASRKSDFLSALYVAQVEAFTELTLIGDLHKDGVRARELIPEKPERVGNVTLFNIDIQIFKIPLNQRFYVDRSSMRLKKLNYCSATEIANADPLDENYRLGVVEMAQIYKGLLKTPHISIVNQKIKEIYARI